jgi:hypothetical protein
MSTKTDVALERGLYRSLIDGSGAIREEAWKRAVAIGDVVGLCRRCEGLMKAVHIPDSGRTQWYGAACNSCWAEIALPGRHRPGIPLHRSSRHDEMPNSTWNNRYELLKKMADLTKQKIKAG